jgi:hypothetical protein
METVELSGRLADGLRGGIFGIGMVDVLTLMSKWSWSRRNLAIRLAPSLVA